MTNENSSLDVLHDSVANADLKKQISDLQERLAQYEPDGEVVHPAFNGEQPRYRLNEPCYLEDDTLHIEGEEIVYLNTPNTSMVPLNEPARKRMEAYLIQLRDGQMAVARQNGRAAPGIVIVDKGELVALAGQDARNKPLEVQPVQMPQEKGIVYPMPNVPDAVAQKKRMGKNKPNPVVSSKMPPPPPRAKVEPGKVLGTQYDTQVGGNKVG